MSAGKSSKKALVKLPGKSKSDRAGLIAGVSRVERRVRDAKIAKQVGASSSVFLTGVIEKVVEGVLLRAGKEAEAGKKKRINVVHIVTAARSDPDSARLLAGFAFGSALDIPKHAPQLMSQDEKKVAKQKKSGAASPDA
jgi:hypothetical protein